MASRGWIVGVGSVGIVAATIVGVAVTRGGASPATTTTAASAVPARAAATVPVSNAAACRAACAAARDRCAIATSTCVADCLADPELRGCLELASSSSCLAASRCALRAACGPDVLAGHGSCRDAGSCQLGCAAGDRACGCRCAATMSPVHAHALLRVDVCVIDCGFDAACSSRRCQLLATTCASQ